jgi:uncharacterized membrane protein YhaH (DUF805 family)
MTMIASPFSPWNRTSRRHYRLAIMLLSTCAIAIWMVGSAIGSTSLLVASILLKCLVAVLTVGRLHDADLSRWSVLLFLFPISFSLNLAHFRLGEIDVHLLNIAAVIRISPVFLGLLCPSRSLVERAIIAPLNAGPL